MLAAEAFLLLGLFRAGLAFVPVHRIVRAITRNEKKDGANEDSGKSLATALRVRWAVEAVVRNSPIEFVCFPQTLAGYTMLRLRGLQSTMVYGVTRSPEGALIAHTWLRMGERTVLGGEGAGEFAPIEQWR